MLKRTINLPTRQSFFLFGARQTGKTTLISTQLGKQKYLSFNLLDSDVFLRLSRDPNLITRAVTQQLESESSDIRYQLFIDEIQRIPELLNEVQLLIDNHKNLQVILTGSSSRKLKRLGTNLGGGRLLYFSLFPLTWNELTNNVSLESVMQFGSLPPVINDLLSSKDPFEAKQAAMRRLRAYLTVYLEEEIRNEGVVRSIGDFSRFLEIAAQNNSGLVQYSNISRESQVARKTVEGYYQILIDTLLAHRLDPYEPSIRKRVALQPKFYLFDTGVVNVIAGELTGEISPERRGMLFETLLICEAFRLRSYTESEASLYFWRTKDGAEIDLLVEKRGKLQAAFEFKSGKNPHIKRKQLGSFFDYFPDVPFYLVTEATNQKIQDSEGEIFGSMITFKEYLELLEKILR
jgi:predicted AAA+ superfamily ATPase